MFRKYLMIFLCDVGALAYIILKKILIFLNCAKNKKGFRILVYHSVTSKQFRKEHSEYDIGLAAFRRQMDILKKTSKKIIKLTEGVNALKRGGLSSDSIAITFDDGTLNVYSEVLRILEELNIPATFFAVNGYIEKGPKENFMDWPRVLSLKAKGFEIGSHSYSHKRVSALKNEDLEREVVGSKKAFEKRGMPVKYFAYPFGFYGDFSPETETAVKRAGYEACFTNIMGENYSGDNLFRLKRTRIAWRDNAFSFRMRINGAYDWVDAIKYKFLRNKNE